MIYDIVHAGDPVLREVAKPIDPKECKKKWLRELVRDMCDTMRDAPGAGLAGPQIGESLRIWVAEDDFESQEGLDEEVIEYYQATAFPFYAMLNPVITPIGTETITRYEGCLSVPGFRAQVTRHASVHIEGINEHGKPVSFDAHGWHARIIQHETDHLNGQLYIDLMDEKTFTTEENIDVDIPRRKRRPPVESSAS